MVLQELGQQLSNALQKLNKVTVVDDSTLKTVLKDISRALVQADISIQNVRTIRDNIMKNVQLQEQAAGMNKQKIIQDAVFHELVAMLDPGVEPYRLKRGKCNVVMFVGLQGERKDYDHRKVCPPLQPPRLENVHGLRRHLSSWRLRPAQAERH